MTPDECGDPGCHAKYRDLRARVEKLAEEWETQYNGPGRMEVNIGEDYNFFARRLREILEGK